MDLQKMFKNFNMKMGLKIVGGLVLGLLILGLLVSLGGFAFRTAFNISPSYSGYGSDYSMSKEMFAPMELSTRNIVSDWDGGYIPGNDAEDFEVTEYSARIKTGNLDKVCGEIKDLKVKSYVIFESSNKNDNNCSYRFKVKKENEDEILQVVQDLKPEDLNINTESIKRQISDFTTEEEILTKKLAQIEEILQEAQEAYDEVAELATKSRDAVALASTISSKLTLIEKLTTERLNTKNNLDRLSQAKAIQLDKLEYTSFTVNISKNLIIDFKAIGDSWERELKNFVNEFNDMLQGISVKLLSFGIRLMQVAIYLIVALFIAKYGWRFVKFVWKK